MNELEKQLEEIKKRIDEKISEVGTRDNEQIKQLEQRTVALEQQIALGKLPKREQEKNAVYREVAECMKNKRAITLSNTGGVNLINDLVEIISDKKDILSLARMEVGASAATKIPIISSGAAIPSKSAEGGTVTEDSSIAMDTCEIDPYTWSSVIPVTYEALLLSGANIEAKIPELLYGAFRTAMYNGMITGTGASSTIKGIFASVPAANLIECAAAGLPTKEDLKKLAIKIKSKNFAAPCIVIGTEVYDAVTAAPVGYDPIYNSLVSETPNILSIPVYVCAGSPADTTAGKVIAFAGEMSNYAFGIASEVTIDVLKKVGDTKTYYQALMAFSGKCINEKNNYGLKCKAGS